MKNIKIIISINLQNKIWLLFISRNNYTNLNLLFLFKQNFEFDANLNTTHFEFFVISKYCANDSYTNSFGYPKNKSLHILFSNSEASFVLI